jgi:hypothetical protein
MRGNFARWGNFAELEGCYDEVFFCHVVIITLIT